MSAFNQGLMTGAQLGQGAYRQKQQRQVGGLMAGGDYAGAAAAAYGQGDLPTGQGIERIGQQQEAAQRQGQIVGALKTNDYEGAMGFASSPEEMAQVTAFRDNASDAERAAAAQKAVGMASVIESIQRLPPEQQLAAARQAAPQFGVDPNNITPDALGQLDAYRIQAMGLADFLSYRDRLADNARQDRQADEAERRNRATEGQANARIGVAQTRESRVAANAGRRSSGGGGVSTAPVKAPRPGGGGSLPPGFTIRRR